MAICNLSEKGRILKNILGFDIAFFLIFSAVNGTISIQSVLNQEAGLGVLSSTLAFTVQLFTCLIIPQFILEFIGFKWTMVVAEIGYLLYVSANIYPKHFTMLPGSVLLGFSQSLAWTVLGIYTQILSSKYAKVNKIPFLTAQNLFFGIFGSIFMLSSCLGSMLIALILKPELSAALDSANSTLSNATSLIKEPYNYARYCGFRNCPTDKLPDSSSRTSLLSVYMLCGAMIFLCFMAIVITVLLVDNRVSVDDDEKKQSKTKMTASVMGSRIKQEFVNLAKLFKTVDIYLLIPISMYTGYELTFMWTEFNRAFVSCLASVNYIGWTNIVYGAFGAILSFFFGYIAKYTSRFPIIILVLAISMGISIFVITWTPNPEAIAVLFFVYIAFAFVQSVTTGQVRGLFGAQFPTNIGAFSAATLFQTFGFIAGFASSIYMCTNMKTFIYLGLAFLSFLSYGGLAIKNSYNEQKKGDLKENVADVDEKETLFIEEKK